MENEKCFFERKILILTRGSARKQDDATRAYLDRAVSSHHPQQHTYGSVRFTKGPSQPTPFSIGNPIAKEYYIGKDKSEDFLTKRIQSIQNRMQRFISFAQLLPLLLSVFGRTTWAFTSPATTVAPSNVAGFSSSVVVLKAGGFEWEDPTDEQFDQGVENPFKNPELMKAIKKDGEGDDDEAKTIDPARLLGPRLQGSNLYLVGMMGSGKSSVGDKLARRKCEFKAEEFFFHNRQNPILMPMFLLLSVVCAPISNNAIDFCCAGS